MLRNRQLLCNLRNTSKLAARTYKTELLPESAKAYINGKWFDAIGGCVFEVKNKFSGELLYDVANCDVQEAQLAVTAARKAFKEWSFGTTAKERGFILRRWYEILSAKEKALAELLTAEQGKPLAEACAEIQYSASYLEFYSAEARRVYGQVVASPRPNHAHYHVREPIGVIGVITPWNFPSAMIVRKAAAAFAVGCTLVVKPAEDTPLSALALAQTASEAGLPKGVFNVIPSDRSKTANISKYLCESTDVDCISFTGSTVVGKLLAAQSASTVKRLCLELGGNAPFIVFESACLDNAVKNAMASKFRCSGQTCVSANRFFVHTSVHDAFVEKLAATMAKSLKCGNGADKNVTQGPLINQRAVEKVTTLVNDAVKKGAKIVCGGKPLSADLTIFEPTILVDVPATAQIAHEEIFGPVVAIQRFETELEMLARANATRSGLAGYFCSGDSAQIYRVQSALQVGMVGVNEGAISCAEAAFGGYKESGLGREGGAQGIDEFTQWKYICQSFA